MKRTRTFRRGLLASMVALAIMGGGILACSSGDDDGDTEATGITITPQTAALYVAGDDEHLHSIELTATITPENTTNKTVTWSASDETYIELSATTGEKITVTAKQPGSVAITATTANGNSATTTITVYPNVQSAETFEIAEGSYSAGDTKITINKDGTVSIGGGSGTATVTKNDDGSTTLTVTIDGTEHTIVIAADGSMTYNDTPLVKEATDITIAPQEAALYINGERDDTPKAIELTATVVPADAADKTVTWSIEGDGVAMLSATSGEKTTVTAQKTGSATVTATTANGISKTITVTVKVQPVLVANGTETKYPTIQSALDAVSTTGGDYTIKLPKGTYSENYLHYNGAATVTISGDTAEKYGADVIITGRGSNMAKERERELLEFQGTGNLILENVSFVSDYSRADHSGDVQAEVVGFDSTGYLAAYNCAFKSHQDTLRTTGKAWFYQCYVEGDVDFIWMESTGIVALYEECEIVSVYDENATTHETKICAPRMSPTSKAGKGVVIYNSNVKEDDRGAEQKTYLARTPWAKKDGYWNQVAYIKTKLSSIEANPWFDKTPCNTADGIPQTVIGWKLCKESAASFGYAGNGDIVSDGDVASEFSGRRAILNRLYDTSAGKYKKDSETHWDIDAFITKTGWNVAADTSKDLLDGETEAKVTTYTFNKEISEYTDLTASGFAKEADKDHAQAKTAGSTLSFPVTGKAVVTVTGYYKGLGTIEATDQGKALYDFNNGSTSKTIEKTYIVYTGASTVTITADAETYITKIVVEYDDGLAFAPVTTIAVSADSNATSVAAKKTLQFSATLTPGKPTNDDILWSIVSGSDAATIDARSGLLTALSPSVATEVTVKATSCDKNGVSGQKTVTVEALVAGAFDISWLDSEEHSKADNIAPTNGNAEVATGGTGTASDSGWSYNSGKLENGTYGAKGGLTVATSDANPFPAGYDAMYIDFPITAVANCAITSVKLSGVNHGTGNIKSAVSYKKAGAADFTLLKTDIATRQVAPELVETNIILSAGETATLRVSLGAASEQKGSRSPTIGTVTVYGEKLVRAEGLYDFAAGYKTTYSHSQLDSDGLEFVGDRTNQCVEHNYGVVIKNNGCLLLKVTGDCTVTFTGSTYSSGNMDASVETENAGTITPASQNVVVSTDKTGTYSFDYTGNAATLKFLCGGQAYTPSVTVTYK